MDVARAATRCTLFFHYQIEESSSFFFFLSPFLFLVHDFHRREISFLAPAPSLIIKRKISSGEGEGERRIFRWGFAWKLSFRIIIPDKRAPSRPIMLQSFATATQLSPGFSSGPVSLRKHSRERGESEFFFLLFFFSSRNESSKIL